MGRPEVDPVPLLIEQLSDRDPRRRALAADALGQSGAAAERAAAPLQRALADPDSRVRASAALALGGIGRLGPGAVYALRQALQDKSEDVRMSARTALSRLKLGR